MLAIKLQKTYLFDEFLRLEERSDVRHEYHEGQVYAMAGETVRHSQIGTNLMIGLGLLLKDKPCAIYGSSMKVRIKNEALDKSLYPDLSITCREEDKQGDKTFIEFPGVIIEILSKSTESYDRGDKFLFYRNLDSLENYILISQTRQLVEVYSKAEKNVWNLTLYHQGVISIPHLELSLSIESIYNKVQ